jgi:hypothetical protein
MLNAERYGPTPGESVAAIWTDLDFPPNKREYPVVQRFLTVVGSMYVNGGAWFGSFRVPSKASFKWYASRGRLEEMDFFDRFWQTDSVRSLFPELAAPAGFRCDPPFRLGNAFTLDGELAAAIFCGGAYANCQGTAAEAKAFGQEVCAELIGTRFDEVYVFVNHARWCGLFDGIVDWTWLLLDRRASLIHVLCASDVD